jgi:hypothetical protein
MKGAAIYLRRNASFALAGLQRIKPAGIKPGWFFILGISKILLLSNVFTYKI